MESRFDIGNIVSLCAYNNGACPACAGGQLSALTDPKSNAWAFNYDQYGRLTDTANPLGQKKTYQYDKMSRVTEVKDPSGNITAYTYDALNRLTKKDVQTTSGERSVTSYVYDVVGNLLNAANGGSMVSFAYDALNRPVKTTQTFGGKSYTIGYAFDAVGNRTAMAAPWGRYSYTYDALSRVTSIVNPRDITVTFGYDAVGRRTKKTIFKNAPEILAETSYSYDAAGQLLSIVNKAGGKVVAFANYEYDAAGNRIKKEDRDGTIKYRYDASNRLITAEPVPMNMPEAEVFIYDKNGNRRYDRGAWDYKYDAANRLLENSTYTYTHDLNGNLTGQTNKNDSSAITYAYNPEQQLSEVTTPEHKVHYRYDPLGRRIEKIVDGNAGRFLYDGQDIVADIDASGNLINTYTNGLGVDEPLLMTNAENENYFYFTDAMGSITALTDANNKIIETYAYRAYGQPRIRNSQGQVIPSSTIGNTRMFTAREYEEESGLYNNRARYMDPARGAFIQEDPLRFNSQTFNLFLYASNSPLNEADPFGLYASVRVGNAKIYIAVPIEFSGSGASPELIDFIKGAIENSWTGKFGKFDVVTTVLLDGKSKQTNRITILEGAGRSETSRAGTGNWYSEMTDWQAAHEAAHLMGPIDEYDLATGIPFPGWEQDILGKCGSPVTEKTIYRVIQYALGSRRLTIE